MVTRGATQQSSAPLNRRVVLDVIRRQGEISRKDIIDRVGLSPQTVANITQDLEAIGLIVSKRLRGEKARGQPPMAFMLNPAGGDSIGISLEPHRAYGALVNLVGDVLLRREIEIDVRDQRRTLAAMVALVRELAERASASERLWGVGVAMPGPFDVPAMSFVGPTAFEGWTDLSIFEDLEAATGLPIYYNIDSVAGAIGESLSGVAQGFESFFYLHLGVGLGGTLMVDKAAYRGARGNATEIGHIPIVPGGRPCYCGARGCLERYLSLHSLSEAITGDPDVELSHPELSALLERGDPRLDAWRAEAAACLRGAVTIIENMLDPETIVIGGSAPRVLVEQLVAEALPLAPSVRTGASDTPRIILSEWQEDSSILGAAVLPIHERLSPRLDVLTPVEERAGIEVERLLGRKPRRINRF